MCVYGWGRKYYKNPFPFERMISSKEWGHILLATIVLGFAGAWAEFGLPNMVNFLLVSGIFFSILLVNVTAKKLVAHYFEAKIEISILKIGRYWFGKADYLRERIPIGIFLPFIFSILSLGKFPWYACLETNTAAMKARASKRHGHRSFSELCDAHIANIVSTGLVAVLFLAVIANILGITIFARLSIFFVLFNLIPILRLDGCEMFFCRRSLWYLVTILTLVMLLFIVL